MVECLELPLTICSERITTVSISGSVQISSKSPRHKQNYITQYATRPVFDENLSFSEYVHRLLHKNDDQIDVIHLVGMNNTPVFPVSSSYARSTLIAHIPWRNSAYHQMTNENCVHHFYEKIKKKGIPQHCTIEFYSS